MSRNKILCLNPKLCGVHFHYDDTNAQCWNADKLGLKSSASSPSMKLSSPEHVVTKDWQVSLRDGPDYYIKDEAYDIRGKCLLNSEGKLTSFTIDKLSEDAKTDTIDINLRAEVGAYLRAWIEHEIFRRDNPGYISGKVPLTPDEYEERLKVARALILDLAIEYGNKFHFDRAYLGRPTFIMEFQALTNNESDWSRFIAAANRAIVRNWPEFAELEIGEYNIDSHGLAFPAELSSAKYVPSTEERYMLRVQPKARGYKLLIRDESHIELRMMVYPAGWSPISDGQRRISIDEEFTAKVMKNLLPD